MSEKIKNKKIAVIGAGISGITLASKLSNLNEVVVFDKSRGIGGRMATRRVDDYHFDHGAQFFTAKSDEFKELCQTAKDDNVVEEWKCRFVEIIGSNIDAKPHANKNLYFVAKPQMNSLCKYVGKDLNILLGKQVESIDFNCNKWSLQTSKGEKHEGFDYLFLAIPSHQAANLIPKNFQYSDIISNIKMSGCFTLMLGFKEDLKIDFDAALVRESIINWISVNSSKPERLNSFSIVVNSSNKWADDNIEEDLEIIKQKMTTALRKMFNFDLNNIKYHNIHRWRYANANLREGNKSLFDPNLNLGVCGDWLIGGKVENAFLSGLDLYKNINDNLNNE
jgi:predicted NAD/FAD-dependent oxidoreductase